MATSLKFVWMKMQTAIWKGFQVMFMLNILDKLFSRAEGKLMLE